MYCLDIRGLMPNERGERVLFSEKLRASLMGDQGLGSPESEQTFAISTSPNEQSVTTLPSRCQEAESTASGHNPFSCRPRNNELATTETLDNAIAKAANSGRNVIPHGLNTPAAMGIPMTL